MRFIVSLLALRRSEERGDIVDRVGDAARLTGERQLEAVDRLIEALGIGEVVERAGAHLNLLDALREPRTLEALARLQRGERLRGGENGLFAHGRERGDAVFELRERRLTVALCSQITSERAVEEAGYKVGSDVAFAMDAAASELYSEEDGMYHFPGEAQTHAEVDVNLRRPDTQGGAYTSDAHVKTQEITEKKEVLRSAQEMISLYEELTTEYPLISIEDGLDEDDWEGWQELTKRMKEQVMLVGDDLFVTNVKRIRCGMDLKVANAVLIKVNQIGTLTEAMDAIELAQKNGYKAIISHRSGETEDSFIADLAVAVNAGWIKTGAPCRGERTAKYNQLLRISETL